MNKICLTILAVVALSGAAYASGKDNDNRGSENYFDSYSTQLKKKAPTMTVVSPLAIEENARALTTFERMKKIIDENDTSRRHD